MKHLTKLQKKKADKIIKLCTELYSDGVITIMASTPDNRLGFYRSDKRLEFDEFIKACNEFDAVYFPRQQKIDFDQIGL